MNLKNCILKYRFKIDLLRKSAQKNKTKYLCFIF